MLFKEVLKGNKIFTIDRNIKNISYGLIPECLESPGWGSIIFTRSTAASVCRRKKIFTPFKIPIHVLFLSVLFLPPWQPGSCEKFQFNRQHFQHGCFLDYFEEPNISTCIIEYGGDFAFAYCSWFEGSSFRPVFSRDIVLIAWGSKKTNKTSFFSH